MEKLAGHPGDRVDELIELARQDAIDCQALPESLADSVPMHGRS